MMSRNIEKILEEILLELQIHNKLKALELTHAMAKDAPLSVRLNKDVQNALLKDFEETLQGHGLKEMTE